MEPSHIAYKVVDFYKTIDAGKEKRSVWYKIGAVWPHKNGSGFDLVIPEGVSVSGRVVCIEPKSDEADPQPAEDTKAG